MKTAIVVSLLALCVLGVSAVDAAPTCTDLAGQGTLCQEVVADPATGVYVFVDVQVAPTIPPL